MPRAEKKIEGGDVMEDSWEAQVDESLDVKGCSLGEEVLSSRRERAWTEEMEGRERRVERMNEPWRVCELWIA